MFFHDKWVEHSRNSLANEGGKNVIKLGNSFIANLQFAIMHIFDFEVNHIDEDVQHILLDGDVMSIDGIVIGQIFIYFLGHNVSDIG